MSIYEMTNNEINEISGATVSVSLASFWKPIPWYASIDPLTGVLTVGHGEITFRQLNIDNPFSRK
jgi:hypothetical protein